MSTSEFTKVTSALAKANIKWKEVMYDRLAGAVLQVLYPTGRFTIFVYFAGGDIPVRQNGDDGDLLSDTKAKDADEVVEIISKWL